MTIWISRVAHGNPMTIKKYLNKKNIRVQHIKQTSHLDAKYKSFQAVVLRRDFMNVSSNNFWPDDVSCQKWNERKQVMNRTRTYSNSKFTDRYRS